MYIFLRILIGLVLFVSGLEKAISPYQNFDYVIQGYQLLPPALATLTAKIFPWIELVVGLFLILGLVLRWALIGALLNFLTFVIVVGQALIRRIPLDECGCFGELISIPPPIVFTMDILVVILILFLLKNLDKTRAFSLDNVLK